VQTWAGCLSGSIGVNLLALDLQSYLNVGAIPGNRREDVYQPTLNLVLPYYVSTAVIGLLPLVRRRAWSHARVGQHAPGSAAPRRVSPYVSSLT